MLSLAVIFFIILATLVLGLIIFVNNPKDVINRVFLLLTFWIVVWQSSNLLENVITEKSWAELFLRMDFMSAVLVGYSWLLFCFIFPAPQKISGYFKAIIFLVAAVFCVMSFTDLVINNVHFELNTIRFGSGEVWSLYAIVVFCFFAGGYIDLIIKLFRLRGITRVQVIYVLAGFSISSLIALFINLFLSSFVDATVSRFALYGMIIFIIFTSYAIIKHHLMNIKVIATELFSVLLVFISLLEVFLARTALEMVVRAGILVVTLIFATSLIRSVLNEVRRREEMEKLTEELKKTTKKLATANKELERLDQAKSEFLSIASHQLRTPSTIIKGYISMMLEGSFGKIPKLIKENLNKVYVSNERLLNLIETLLNISRIESGRLEFNTQPIDLAKLIEPIVNDFQKKAKEKKLKLEFKAEPNVPEAMADPQKVKEVISNLIDNSVKYTNEGEIIIGLHQESQSVVFTCQDTGIGIEPEDVPRLFNKFVRGKGMMQVYTEGTGLGLYFARMVIENMGGRIWAESPGKGKGSKFSFSLTMADKSKAKKVG